MCGITGLIHLSGQSIDPSLLLGMNLAINHRGRDDQGVFVDRDIGLSNRRLRIIGEKNEGRQPMHFKERYHFVFNGTLYNYKALAEKLKAKNIPVNTSSDTEIAFTWLIHFGLINLSEWEGMYSFIFYDSRDKVVWIRRDALGIKPLYFAYLNGYLAFSSETKSFFHFPDWSYEVDNEKINLFLTTGKREIKGDPFWKKAKAVPVGCTFIISYQCNRHFHLTIAADKNEKSDLFDLPPKLLSFKEATIQGRLLFENALNTHISGNGPVGLSLSGGLDSSLILSFLKYLHPQKIPSVISYSEIENKEINVLKNHFTADYYSIPVPSWEEFQQTHEEIISLSEGPLPGPNVVYHFNIYTFAQNIGIKIMLSGQGADELFMGYPGFVKSYWTELYTDKKYKKLISEVLWTSFLRKDLYLYGLHFLKRWKKEPPSSLPVPLNLNRDNALFNSNLPYLLHAEDRHSLANHIEARVPFLDHQFQTFARRLPPGYAIHQGKQKWILRAIGKDLLPESTLHYYTKKGFPAKMPEPNQREKMAFLSDVKEFISQYSHFFLPTREPIQLFHQYPALTWRINSLHKWLKIYNIQAT
jgi:asparagine synthase (glutamine-hydrolysing)